MSDETRKRYKVLNFKRKTKNGHFSDRTEFIANQSIINILQIKTTYLVTRTVSRGRYDPEK